MVTDTDPKVESDLRRRAAWLLAMLIVVAVLLVIVISALAKPRGHNHGNGGPGPLDNAATGLPATRTPTAQRSQQPTQQPSQHRPSHPATHTKSRTSSPPTAVTTSCPGARPCILNGDVGNTIDWINAYRAQHGLGAVQGSVSPRAQACALSNGSGCGGSWAETFLADPSGRMAVHKILPFAHLLDPQMKRVGVGWAYSPAARTYYFAIVSKG